MAFLFVSLNYTNGGIKTRNDPSPIQTFFWYNRIEKTIKDRQKFAASLIVFFLNMRGIQF